MSMAEIVGLVSGAITLADASHKAGSGILALRRLWNDVHDVPDSINSLLDRLSLVHSVLADLKDQLSRDQNILPANSAIQLSVQYCDKAIQNLDTLVNELKQNVEDKARLRRNKARIKVVFERDVIQRLERGLQDALQLLGIAQQTYAVALMRQQPSLIATQISTQAGTPSTSGSPSTTQTLSPRKHEPPSATEATCDICKTTNAGFLSLPWIYSRFLGSYTSKSSFINSTGLSAPAEETYRARVQLPSWLARSVWDICAKRASNGWTYSLRHWTIRPERTEIFETAFKGNLASVVQIFDDRTGSLYDRDPQGWTLLHYAAFHGNLEKVTYLMQKGLSIHETNNDGSSPLYYLCRNADQATEVLSTYRFLKSAEDLTGAANTVFFSIRSGASHQKSTLHRFIWSVPGLLDLVLDEFHLVPIESRFKSIIWRYVDPKVLLDTILRENLIDAEVLRQQLHAEPTRSLHEFAKVYFQNVPGGANAEDQVVHQLGTAFEDWRELARWLFQGITSEDLSRQGNDSWEATTPLFAGLLGCGWEIPCSPWELRRNKRRLDAAISFWLEDLKSAGVDLKKYGKWERTMFRESYMLRSARWERLACGGGDEGNGQGPILVSIQSGPCPGDWELVFDSFGETFVGAFFEWAESKRPLMPGSWDEDDVD